MSQNHSGKKALKRFFELSRRREEILALDPKKALDAILDSQQPTALIHSFPEEDFYFLVNDIGLEDSLELLALASDRQWEYFLDLELWERDSLDMPAATRWLNLLFKVDPRRFLRWAVDEKAEFLEYYLYKNIEVKIREHDQEPSEFGEEYFSLDETLYIKFCDEIFESEADEAHLNLADKKLRDEFLSAFIERLADHDYLRYQSLLFESANVIPAEAEEEAYRLRNVRLAEKGFEPFDQAVGIYQPLKPQGFERQSPKALRKKGQPESLLPAPSYFASALGSENLFVKALEQVEAREVLEQVQLEFAGLCNRVTAADQKKIRDREALKGVVEKVCGYINIGLERLAPEEDPAGPRHAVSLVRNYPLSSIFRVGFGLALDLKWRAEKWRKSSWFETQGLLLNFWGREWMGTLGGLLLKKPLFFEPGASGELYREFNSIHDIEKTRGILDQIITVDEVLALIGVAPMPVVRGLLTYKSLILTLWAREYLGLTKEPAAIAIDQFRRFFDAIWSGKSLPRKIKTSVKTSFSDWLTDRTGLVRAEISQALGGTLENLFREIEIEYGAISPKDLDPRYIHLFLIERKKP